MEIYCINPKCQTRENPRDAQHCKACRTPLLIGNRYRLIHPLRELNPARPTDIFEVEDWGTDEVEWGTRKVIKILKSTHNPELIRLFKQEARILIWLRDPAFPKVEPDGFFNLNLSYGQRIHCLVMEKIAGETLEIGLNQNSLLSQKIAIDWLHKIVEILAIIHHQNIIHRDIKPSNLMLKADGTLALIDFGMAGIGQQETTKVGSLGYMAPEQLTGQAVWQSDFFALGRTFVHLLSGRPPLDFATKPKTGQLIWRESVPHLQKPLANLIDRLMAPQPRKRPKTAKAILKQLAEIAPS